MANYPFPNQKLELGSTGRFVTDLQRELNIAVTGVFDFLTMCKVALHKFEHGLNHNDPTVDETTWNSIFKGGGENNQAAAAAPAAPGDRVGVATVGQVPRSADTSPVADVPGNPRATTTGTTSATDENSVPNVETDKPREDQPTVTAGEQAAAGGPAGGFAAAPVADQETNAPQAAAEDTAGPTQPGTATP